MSRQERARAAQRRIHGQACGSCGGDVGTHPQFVIVAGENWPTCRTCYQDVTLVGHHYEVAMFGAVADKTSGELIVAEVRAATSWSYYERSAVHRAAAILKTGLTHDLAFVAEHHRGPLLYVDVDNAMPGDPAQRPWGFVHGLKEAYDARRARREQTHARFPNGGCCGLCGVDRVPPNPTANAATDPDERFASMIGEFGGKHYCGPCTNTLTEAQNSGKNVVEAVDTALRWRLAEILGVPVPGGPEAFGITVPPPGHKGAEKPFGWCGLDVAALREHIGRHTETTKTPIDLSFLRQQVDA